MLVRLLLVYPLAFLCGAGISYTGLRFFAPRLSARYQREVTEFDERLHDLFIHDVTGQWLALIRFTAAPAVLLVVWIATGSLPFSVLAGGVVFAAPRFILDIAARRRRDRLERQVLDAIASISATSKAGLNLIQSIEEVASRMPPPICQEFAMIQERVRAGQPLETALAACDRRLDIPNLSLVVQAILVSLERGGRLPELLEKLADSLREIHRVEERVKTETSGIKLSSKLMAAMPLVIGLLLYMVSPEQVTMLFNTLLGNLILIAVVALDVIGFTIIRKLGELEV